MNDIRRAQESAAHVTRRTSAAYRQGFQDGARSQEPSEWVQQKITEARAELEAAIDRVRYLHGQRSDLGMAPGKWCPSCGYPAPCPTIRALNGGS